MGRGGGKLHPCRQNKATYVKSLFLTGVQFENVQEFNEKYNILRSKYESAQGDELSSTREKLSRRIKRHHPSRRNRIKSRSDTDGSDNCISRRSYRNRRQRAKQLSKPLSKSTLGSDLSPSLKKDDNHFPKLGYGKKQFEDTNDSGDQSKS